MLVDLEGRSVSQYAGCLSLSISGSFIYIVGYVSKLMSSFLINWNLPSFFQFRFHLVFWIVDPDKYGPLPTLSLRGHSFQMKKLAIYKIRHINGQKLLFFDITWQKPYIYFYITHNKISNSQCLLHGKQSYSKIFYFVKLMLAMGIVI